MQIGYGFNALGADSGKANSPPSCSCPTTCDAGGAYASILDVQFKPDARMKTTLADRRAAALVADLESRGKRDIVWGQVLGNATKRIERCNVKLIIHERDDISYVALEGRLDSTGVEEMEQPFAEATTARGLPTVVDVSGITFMSSLGIGFLFANTKKLKKAGCKLVLLNPKGMVETVLRTSKMDKVMPIAHKLDEAILAVGGDPTIVTDVSPAETDRAVAEQETVSAPSDTPDNILKLTITNEMSELEGLYATVNQLLARHQVPYRSGYAVNLALEELAVNVIRYAYVDDDQHTIDIGLGVIDERIILEIRDSGRPFDPRETPPHDPDVEDLEVGGLGLTLVLDLVDALTYRRENEKNHVQVCIQIRADEGGELWNAVNDGAGAGSE